MHSCLNQRANNTHKSTQRRVRKVASKFGANPPNLDRCCLTYLVQCGQNGVGHVVLDHGRRYEHLIEVGVLHPDGLVDGLTGFQHMSGGGCLCGFFLFG